MLMHKYPVNSAAIDDASQWGYASPGPWNKGRYKAASQSSIPQKFMRSNDDNTGNKKNKRQYKELDNHPPQDAPTMPLRKKPAVFDDRAFTQNGKDWDKR